MREEAPTEEKDKGRELVTDIVTTYGRIKGYASNDKENICLLSDNIIISCGQYTTIHPHFKYTI